MATNPTDRRLHPAVSILCWLLYALSVEWAGGHALGMLAAMTTLVYVAQAEAMPGFFRLIRRSRWLLVSLVLLYAWTINGAWLWPQLGSLSPTLEGLMTGGERVVRLVLLLAALALLLNKLSRDELVYGLYQLAWPFAKAGFDRRAFAVRLALAMEWARSEKTRGKIGMVDALRAALNAEEPGPQEIRFESRALAWPDGLALAMMLTLLGASL